MKRIAALGIGFAAVLASAPSARAANASVTIQNFSFQPSSVSVAVGDMVTWTHMDGSTPHTVTADEGAFDSSPSCAPSTGLGCMTGGNTFSHTFVQAGTFAYHCKVHPNMHGTVTVASAQPPMTQPPATAPPATAPPRTTAPAPRPANAPATTATPATTAPTTTAAPPAAADANASTTTTAAAGDGGRSVALEAKHAGGGSGVNPGVVAVAVVAVGGAAAGGLLLHRRLR